MSPGSDQTALGIYVVMARDWSDALTMIQECNDKTALEILLQMLTVEGSGCSDSELNRLFVEPVKRQIERFSP